MRLRTFSIVVWPFKATIKTSSRFRPSSIESDAMGSRPFSRIQPKRARFKPALPPFPRAARFLLDRLGAYNLHSTATRVTFAEALDPKNNAFGFFRLVLAV